MQVYSQIDQLPTTFLINPAVLSANKLKINEADKELGHILSKVILLAEEAMDNGPYSVTYKEKTPPSGDKRDYMSVGPYWWPDSTKSNGLPYIRRDGIVNPERNEIQDAEFFKSVCSDLFLLSLTEYFTGNKKYAEKAVDILHTWFLDEKTRMNPHLNYGQSIPGRTEGRGIGLIDTRSLVYLIDGIQILKTTGHLPNDTYEGIQIWFKEFLNWMITSEIGLDEADEHNNHGTYYDVQTVAIALFTDQKELATNIINQQTKKRIETQFAEDGSQPHELARTLSWNYSVMNLMGFFELALLAENVDIDLWNYETSNGKSIKKGFLWLLPYSEGLPWQHTQIKPIDLSSIKKLSLIASLKYPDIKIKQVETNSERDYLFELVH
jgi:hypothetical protein